MFVNENWWSFERVTKLLDRRNISADKFINWRNYLTNEIFTSS